MEEFFNLQNDISEMQEITVNLQRIGGSIHLTLLHGRREDFQFCQEEKASNFLLLKYHLRIRFVKYTRSINMKSKIRLASQDPEFRTYAKSPRTIEPDLSQTVVSVSLS